MPPDSRQAAYDVVCVADLCVDVLVTGDVVPRFGQFEQLVDTFSIEAGGSGAIFGAQLARLGASVQVRGAVGSDLLGEAALEPLRAAGVDLGAVRRLPDVATGVGLHLVKPDGDRGCLTYMGAIGRTGPEDLPPDPVGAARHWHVASYFLLGRLRARWPDWLARCKSGGVTTSLDTNWDPDASWAGALDLLPLIDVFLPNEAEARAISGADDTDAAGCELSRRAQVVVIKCGAGGAAAYRAGQQVARYLRGPMALPIPVADAVGAGDSFDAGFLRGWMLGWPTDRCLGLGARCAEATLAMPGGFRGQIREPVT